MADNTEEEHLESPTDIPSEEPTDETTSNQKAEIVNPIHKIENMEVHHHSHSSHEKNAWKSYAREFLMLFLAVFCGFLAEYFLEHRIEKEKGKQYVQSMIEDMISDSTKINQTLEYSRKQELGLDSLSVLFNNPPYNDRTIKEMYILMMKYTMNEANVEWTKRTASQLKNSGGLRLISNKISADEITRYIEGAEDIESQGDYFKNYAFNEVVKLNNQIFYLKYIKGLTRKDIPSFKTKKHIKLANNNEKLLAQYSNQLIFTSGVLINYNNKLTNFKSQISKRIEILKKENHIR